MPCSSTARSSTAYAPPSCGCRRRAGRSAGRAGPRRPCRRSRNPIRRLRQTCEAELEQTIVSDVAPGAIVERRIVPMQRVGLYVPGGLAPLVSTVIMNAVPAQVAGVPGIAVASPPQNEFGGLPHPTILAACALLGIDEVYAAGGAQALAMFAYGAGECRAGQPDHRPGQHLRRRGQAPPAGHRQHRRRGRTDRDRDHRRRHRRCRVRRR